MSTGPSHGAGSSISEGNIHALGQRLWERIQHESPGAFDRAFWVGKVLEWAMDDRDFKVDLFRLVDVLPVLESADQVRRHMEDYLLKAGRTLPPGVETALRIGASGWTGGLASLAVRKGVGEMGRRFIAGETPSDALEALHGLHRSGFAFTVDLLGEATHGSRDADAYQARYLDLIETLTRTAGGWPEQPPVDGAGHPRVNISVKISALEPHMEPADPGGSVSRVLERLMPVVLQARAAGVFVNFDMEQWDYHEIILRAFEAICREPALRDYPHLGIAVQAYTPQAQADLGRLLILARDRGTPVTIRLVKGAYWDYEMVRSALHGYPLPVYRHKAQSDANFERMTEFLLTHHTHLRPAIGSHNLRSITHALVRAEAWDVPEGAMEFQMLYGMAEPMRQALRDEGHRVRIYTPVGALLPGMAYLVRRLLENTSNEGFLSQAYQRGVALADLLQRPQNGPDTGGTPAREGFSNCPHGDFTDGEFRNRFAVAVDAVGEALPVEVPVVVGGVRRLDGERQLRPCPSATGRRVAEVCLATAEEVDRAVAGAMGAWPAWRNTPIDERAGVLERLADALEADRCRLAALQVHEVGKPWREADGDVAEAIDFCRYYARHARAILGPRPMQNVAGEHNTLYHDGRGPAAIIAPWNFPLAILTGMTTAAMVTGNTVLLKPAEQSSATGYALFRHLQALNLPPGVAQFLPGLGEVAGARLVAHPQVATVAFTGSEAVGQGILAACGNTAPGQPQIKRAICEMGGKNAIIVDADADFDDAVAGVVQSAFGYAGQKCSACSRVFVVAPGWDPFITRLADAARSLKVAPAEDPSCQVPPVVDEAAFARLLAEIRELEGRGALLFRGHAPAGGYFIPPVIVRVDDLDHHLMQDELFGPILAVKPVDSFGEALDSANHTRYALTGAVYSRSPTHLDEARRRFRVGNLYLNRGTTGAMVGRQPFGGFAMSGTDAKAGGPHYLLQFTDPRVVTENTLRRGFSPDVME